MAKKKEKDNQLGQLLRKKTKNMCWQPHTRRTQLMAQPFTSLTKVITDNCRYQHEESSTVQSHSFFLPSSQSGVVPPEEHARFYHWRSKVAEGLSSKKELPFESNILVWNEFRKVVFRSDMVVQVIDARDPLFTLNLEFIEFCGKVLAKPTLVLLNKSDFLTEQSVSLWNSFFSALTAYCENQRGFSFGLVFTSNLSTVCIPEVLSSADLKTRLAATGLRSFGFVGLPNVGKSSCLNGLLEKKQVAVSSSAGKTRTFQNHFLKVCGHTLNLIDSPGLVFPMLNASIKWPFERFVLGGVLKIDSLSKTESSAKLVWFLCDAKVLEFFGIKERPSTFENWTEVLGKKLRLTKKFGEINKKEVFKKVLKEFVVGSFVFNREPPENEQIPNLFYKQFVV